MSHHLLPEAGAVLGGDVGWSKKRRTSAACYLAFDRDEASIQVTRFTAHPTDLEQSLCDLVGRRPLLTAAFDGPFRRNLDQIGVYRVCEKVLTVRLAPLIGKPGQPSSRNGRQLNAATNAFVKAALAMLREGLTGETTSCIDDAHHLAAIHASAVAEAFPTSFLGVMLDSGFSEPGKARSDCYFEHLTRTHGDRLTGLAASLLGGRRLRDPLQAFRNDDDRAAIVCAITALCVAARRYTAVGDDNGYIILPPPVAADGCGLEPWAMQILGTNVAQTPGPRLIVEA
jgi:hypothetical protein